MSMLATAIVSKLRDERLEPVDKLILLYLANAHDEVSGWCWVDLKELALDTCTLYNMPHDYQYGPTEFPLEDRLSLLESLFGYISSQGQGTEADEYIYRIDYLDRAPEDVTVLGLQRRRAPRSVEGVKA